MKKKANSKKKSSTTKDNWSLEGGVDYSQIEQKETRKNNTTQSRDDRLIRNKLSSEVRKRQQHFIEKMSKKVKFNELEKQIEIVSENIVSNRGTQLPSSGSINQTTPHERLIKTFAKLSYDKRNSVKNRLLDDITSTQTSEENHIEVNDELVFKSGCDISGYPYKMNVLECSPFYEWFYGSDLNDNVDAFKTSLIASMSSMCCLDTMQPSTEFKIFASLNNNLPRLPTIDLISDIAGIYEMWRRDIPLNTVCRRILPLLFSYCDIFADGRDLLNDLILLEASLIHLLFHAVKSRSTQIRNSCKLKEGLLEEGNNLYRDQGFTRPRILILCPLKSSAKKIVELIQNICGNNTSVSGIEKFDSEYLSAEVEDLQAKQRPRDWEALFSGNIDDDFKLGIQLNPGEGKGTGVSKGVHVRLFSEFSQSDIIIASPIGLKLVIDSNYDSGSSHDFLSSIEQVLVYQADVLHMQNWEHVEYVMRHVNTLPKDINETDFNRVRPYFLNGLAEYHRQLIIISHFTNPEMQSFYRSFGRSRAGQVRIKKQWLSGTIGDVAVPIKQVFQLIPQPPASIHQEEYRFRYFVDNILPQLISEKLSHVLIVAPSYFDYIRIRNELLKLEANAVFICEFSRDSEISRGRARFFQGIKNIMLYSGRAHFFW